MTYFLGSAYVTMCLKCTTGQWIEALAPTRTEIDKRSKTTLYFIKKNQHFSPYRSSYNHPIHQEFPFHSRVWTHHVDSNDDKA